MKIPFKIKLKYLFIWAISIFCFGVNLKNINKEIEKDIDYVLRKNWYKKWYYICNIDMTVDYNPCITFINKWSILYLDWDKVDVIKNTHYKYISKKIELDKFYEITKWDSKENKSVNIDIWDLIYLWEKINHKLLYTDSKWYTIYS